MIKKNKINNNVSLFPMPVVLVGATVEGKVNFLTASWISRANSNPPMIVMALSISRHTKQGVLENKTFSINIPSADSVIKTDYCGSVSGKDIDKSKVFDVFYGELKTAPMIQECPINMECKLIQTIDLATHSLFVGEIVSAYSAEKFLSNGMPDVTKIKPFTLTMPDNKYWLVGECLETAWQIGKSYKGK